MRCLYALLAAACRSEAQRQAIIGSLRKRMRSCVRYIHLSQDANLVGARCRICYSKQPWLLVAPLCGGTSCSHYASLFIVMLAEERDMAGLARPTCDCLKVRLPDSCSTRVAKLLQEGSPSYMTTCDARFIKEQACIACADSNKLSRQPSHRSNICILGPENPAGGACVPRTCGSATI